MGEFIVIRSGNNEKAYYFLHFLLLMLGVTQIVGVPIANIGISVCIAIIICAYPIQLNIVMLFLLAPYFNMFSVELGTTSLYYIFALVYLLKYFKTNKWALKKSKLFVVFALLCITMSWLNTAVQVKWLVLFMLLVINYKDNLFLQRFPLIIKHIGISTITSSIIGYIMLVEGKSIYTQSYIYSSQGNVTRFAGLVGDSVFYGQFAVTVIGAVLALVLMNKISERTGYITTAVLSYFIVITFSKTAIVLLAFVILGYFLALIHKNMHKRKTVYRSLIVLVLLIIAVLGGVSYIASHLNNPMINMYVIRFTSGDLWTGRSSVTDNYIQKLYSSFTHIFVGMPYSEYTQNGVLVGQTTITRAHNIYVETICLFGLIPAVVMFGFCIKKVGSYIKNQNNLFFLAPIMVLILSGVSLHGHIEWTYYFLLAISFCTMDYWLNEKMIGRVL